MARKQQQQQPPPPDPNDPDAGGAGEDDNEPATKGEVKGWIEDAVAGVTDQLQEIVNGASGAGGEPKPDDKGGEPKGEQKPPTKQNVEDQVADKVEKVIGDVLDKRELDERRRKDGSAGSEEKPAGERPPQKPHRLRSFLYGSDKVDA